MILENVYLHYRGIKLRQVTVKDVAKRANVSIASVSRVINNNYTVSPEVKNAVVQAIKDLNFKINMNARNLKNKHSHMIGIVVADISNPYFMTIAKGVESIVGPKGYTMVFASTDEDPKKEDEILRTFSEYRLDGIVLATCGNDSKRINEIIDNGISVVLVDGYVEHVHTDVIIENDQKAVYNMTEYVIKQGHRKICMINGDLSKNTGKERYIGFVSAMEDKNIQIRNEYVISGNFSREEAYKQLKALLERNDIEWPTAIISANNYMTEGVIEVLVEKDIKIPADISVASYGDISLPGLIKPKLTHLMDNTYSVGQKAGEILLENLSGTKQVNQNISGKSFKTIVYDKKLIIGGSIAKII